MPEGNIPQRRVIGRGSIENPKNRFESLGFQEDWEHLDPYDPEAQEPRKVKTEYFDDASQSIITKNNSPDIVFSHSLNPYRGCAHGCSYCYARPYHEYLGFSAGLDFETKIMVKRNAPALFREFLRKRDWKGDVIAMSGVTDCYQGAERRFEITRGCLEVALEARQSLGIITKNALVRRDIDLLGPMAEMNLVVVNISVTSLHQSLTRVLEPQSGSPAARLAAIKALREAGIPVNVMVAPIIPGLNDSEIPRILEAVADAGAGSAGFTLLRLPHGVKDIFLEWLTRNVPADKARIVSRIQACRGGEVSDSRFGQRMRGEGEIAKQIAATFRVFATKFGLAGERSRPDPTLFCPPRRPENRQRELF
ncbi:MAG: PA0069 family radical SAM protein [Pirellulaceae bacterium]